MKRYKIIITACICLLNVIHLQSQTYTFPEMVIEDTTISSGTHIFDNTGAVISPSDTSKHVTITGLANVEFTSSYMVHLKPGFRATAFTGSGYFHAGTNKQAFTASILEPGDTVMKYEKFEVGIDLPAFIDNAVDLYFSNNSTGINPFDPDKLSIEAYFKSPSDSIKRIFGFYFRDYERYFDADYRQNNWTEIETDYNYRIRFAPDEIGEWQCTLKVLVDMGQGLQALSDSLISFSCLPNTDTEHSTYKGYLEIGDSKRYFRFSDTNDPFFAIGENLSWTSYLGAMNPEDFASFSDILTALADSGGANFTRIGMQPYSTNFEREVLGNYANNYTGCWGKTLNRQMNAWELDQIINLLKEKNIYTFLTPEWDGYVKCDTCTIIDTWSWNFNPYNSISGIDEPKDIFSNEVAIEQMKHKFRYLTARWGYSTNIAALELINEADQNFQLYNETGLDSTVVESYRDWHSDMVGYLKANSDFNGLYTTSVGAGPFTVYNLPDLDISSKHSYLHDRDANIRDRYNLAQQLLAVHDKPYIYGEMGISSPQLECCNGISYHNAVWATAFMGGFGNGLQWWWEETFTNEYYKNLKPLSDFIGEVDFDGLNFKQGKYPVNPLDIDTVELFPLEAFYLTSEDSTIIIGWVHNRSYYWYNFDSIWKSCRNIYNANHPPLDLHGYDIDSVPNEYINSYFPSNYPFPPLTKPNDAKNISNVVPIDSANIECKIMQTSALYDVSFYSTTDTSLIYSYTTDTATNLLSLNVPRTDSINPDYAFVIKVHGTNFKSSKIANDLFAEKNRNEINYGNTLANFNNSEMRINIYPNPVNDKLNVDITGLYDEKSANVTIVLCDMLGRKLLSNSLSSNRNCIDISRIESGIYNISILLNNYKSINYKIIKQ